MKEVNLKIVWKQIHRAEEMEIDAAARENSKVKRTYHFLSGTRYVHVVGKNPIVLTFKEKNALEAAGYHELMEELQRIGKSMRMSKLTNKRIRRKINQLVKIGEEKLANAPAPKVEEYKPSQTENSVEPVVTAEEAIYRRICSIEDEQNSSYFTRQNP